MCHSNSEYLYYLQKSRPNLRRLLTRSNGKKEVCLNLSPRMLYRRVSRSFKTRVIRNHNYFLSTVIVYAIRCIACRVQGCQKKGPHDVTLLPLSLYSYVLRLSASRRDNGNVVGPPTSNRIEQRTRDEESRVAEGTI